MQRITHARSHERANAFCQACKRVSSGVQTRLDKRANAFLVVYAFACTCERVWLGVRTRSKRACVIRCIWAVLSWLKFDETSEDDETICNPPNSHAMLEFYDSDPDLPLFSRLVTGCPVDHLTKVNSLIVISTPTSLQNYY